MKVPDTITSLRDLGAWIDTKGLIVGGLELPKDHKIKEIHDLKKQRGLKLTAYKHIPIHYHDDLRLITVKKTANLGPTTLWQKEFLT